MAQQMATLAKDAEATSPNRSLLDNHAAPRSRRAIEEAMERYANKTLTSCRGGVLACSKDAGGNGFDTFHIWWHVPLVKREHLELELDVFPSCMAVARRFQPHAPSNEHRVGNGGLKSAVDSLNLEELGRFDMSENVFEHLRDCKDVRGGAGNCVGGHLPTWT